MVRWPARLLCRCEHGAGSAEGKSCNYTSPRWGDSPFLEAATGESYWPDNSEKSKTDLAPVKSLLEQTLFDGERVLVLLHRIEGRLDELKDSAVLLAAGLRTGSVSHGAVTGGASMGCLKEWRAG